MPSRVRLHVWGERACFTRPEMKVERVSYDVITPSASRGILEAIMWKPEMRWIVERIHVLKPIRFQNVRRNEVKSVGPSHIPKSVRDTGVLGDVGIHVEEDRTQRSMMHLVDVGYVIEARIELTSKAGDGNPLSKYVAMFNRRAGSGQCFHRPSLGMREFPADFELIAPDAPLPLSLITPEQGERDLGWMLHDIDHSRRTPRFFRARMTGGVIDVEACLRDGAAT